MKLLSKSKSLEYIHSIAKIFEYEPGNKIDLYLNSKSWRFWIFANNPNRLPLFFWDERDAKKNFEAVIGLLSYIEDSADGKTYIMSKYDLLPKIAEFLESKNDKKILAVGNWDPFNDPGRGVIQIQTEDLAIFFKQQFFDDIYFFDDNLNWMLAFNHHGQGFFAGSKKFIEDFTDFFPGYRSFVNYHDCKCCQV